MSIIGIVLGLTSIGLIFYFNKKSKQRIDNLLKGDAKDIEQALIALQREFTEYQVFNERKREDLEKIIEKNKKNSERSIEKI